MNKVSCNKYALILFLLKILSYNNHVAVQKIFCSGLEITCILLASWVGLPLPTWSGPYHPCIFSPGKITIGFFVLKILGEEIRDLLDSVSVIKSVTANGHSGKVYGTERPLVQIRELSNGVITLTGSNEVAVSTLHEMVACLKQGSLCRATGSTKMNNQSR